MKKHLWLAAFMAAGIIASGCGPSHYDIRVNGYTDPGSPGLIKPGGSFCIMENPEAKNPLLEKEINGKIAKLLEVRGYSITTFEKADYCLMFAYGMGEPRSVGVATPEGTSGPGGLQLRGRPLRRG